MDLSKLSPADKIVGGAGIVLLIDLLFFPWHSIDLGIITLSRTAIESPNGFWGILALLVTIAVVAALAVRHFTSTAIPELPVPFNRAIFVATIAVLVVLVLKLLAETDFLGIGAWLGILLAAGMVYGGYLKDRETPVH